MKVVPNIDAYGTYARRSALADVLELQAIKKPSMSRSDLADYIRDSHWTRSLSDMFYIPDEEAADLGDEVDASEDAAARVFGILEERREILGGRYPFEIRGHRLSLRGMSGSRLSYCILLGVTVAHAYDLTIVGINPRHYFENLVMVALQQRGLIAGNLGKERREASDFRTALYRIGERCKLSPQAENAIFRKQAQEEGVDVIAHMDWGDSRPLHWVFIVQATCGKSDTWPQKIFDSSELMWKGILGLHVVPRAVFAVPHHMPPDMMRYLAERGNGEKLLLDRLRLCSLNSESIEGSVQVCESLEDIEVEFE